MSEFCENCNSWVVSGSGHSCEQTWLPDEDGIPLDQKFKDIENKNKPRNTIQSKYEFKSHNYWKNKHHIDFRGARAKKIKKKGA